MREGLAETRKSADAALAGAQAAKSNTDALIEIERAWLVFILERGGNDAAAFRLSNVGSTPAWITEIQCFYRKSRTPLSTSVPFTPHILRFENGSILPPRTDTKLISEDLEGGIPLTSLEDQAFARGQLVSHFWRHGEVLGHIWQNARNGRVPVP
jgi:hypothetical protein